VNLCHKRPLSARLPDSRKHACRLVSELVSEIYVSDCSARGFMRQMINQGDVVIPFMNDSGVPGAWRGPQIDYDG